MYLLKDHLDREHEETDISFTSCWGSLSMSVEAMQVLEGLWIGQFSPLKRGKGHKRNHTEFQEAALPGWLSCQLSTSEMPTLGDGSMALYQTLGLLV